MPTHVIKWTALDRGWSPSSPPRSLQPTGQGPVFRNVRNVRFHEGYVMRRPSVSTVSPETQDSPAITQNTVGVTNIDEKNGQIPVRLIDLAAYQNVETTRNDHHIGSAVVTSREIFSSSNIHDPGTPAWSRNLPVYTTGTVDIDTGGVFTIASGSPLWSTHKIQQGNVVIADGEVAVPITNSPSDTTFTCSAWAAGSKTGVSYTIYRNFVEYPLAGAWASPLLVKLFNRDIFVAGALVANNIPAVIRLQDWMITFDKAATYLVSTDLLAVGLDTFTLTSSANTSTIITGLELLDDGRVMVMTSDSADLVRLHFSAPGDQTEWDTSPAGTADLVTHEGPGRGLHRFDRDIAIHYDDGIALGSPTGLRIPPLTYSRTRAHVGACSQNAIQDGLPGGTQAFVALTGGVYLFDGSDVRRLDRNDEARRELSQFQSLVMQSRLFTSWDPYREELGVWMKTGQADSRDYDTATTSAYNDGTLCLTYNFNKDTWTKSVYPMWIGAVATSNWGGTQAAAPTSFKPDGRRVNGHALVGVASVDPEGSTAASTMVLTLKEDGGTDVEPWGSSPAQEVFDGGTFVETDDAEFVDQAGMAQVGHVKRISILCNSLTTRSESLTVGISYDGGNHYTSQSITQGLNAGEDRLFHYTELGQGSGEHARIRVNWPDNGDTKMRLGAITAEVDLAGVDAAQTPFRIEDLASIKLWCRAVDIPLEDDDDWVNADRWGVADTYVSGVLTASRVKIESGTRAVKNQGGSGSMSLNATLTLTGILTIAIAFKQGSSGGTSFDWLGDGSGGVLEIDSDIIKATADAQVTLTGAVGFSNAYHVLIVIRDASDNWTCFHDGTNITSGSPSQTGDVDVTKLFGSGGNTNRLAEIAIWAANHTSDVAAINTYFTNLLP